MSTPFDRFDHITTVEDRLDHAINALRQILTTPNADMDDIHEMALLGLMGASSGTISFTDEEFKHLRIKIRRHRDHE